MSTFVKKAEFARQRGVSRAALTAWQARGLLVLSDDGRVDVEASNARLEERPEIYRGGQCSPPSAEAARKAANARKGSLPAPTAAKVISETSNATKPHSEKWTTAEAIRRKESAVAKLKEIEVKRQDGKYMLTSAARMEMGRIAGRMVTVFDSAIIEFANAIAAQPKITQRDILRVLRATWRDIRVRQAKMISADAESLPPLIEDEEDA
jgi:hypothetical protein